MGIKEASRVSLGAMGFNMDLTAVVYMAFNFIASVGIVFVNKIVIKQFGYNFATFLTALHFVATWIGVLINYKLGMYKVKKLNHLDVFPITASFCSFVVFNNLSLQYNSVGFYQLMKVLTTPVVVILQSLFYGVHLPWKLQLSLVPVCIGVAMATVSDFSFNYNGTFWAVAGLIATAFYQLLVKTRQDLLKCNSFQLLHYQAPQSAAFVALCTPFFDKLFEDDGLLNYKYSTYAVFFICLSCLLAYCVNLSTYLVIGHTSPVSYQVLGHFKLLIILAAGIFIFGEDSNSTRLCGMALAFSGIVSYTTLKQNLKSGWEKSSPHGKSSPNATISTAGFKGKPVFDCEEEKEGHETISLKN